MNTLNFVLLVIAVGAIAFDVWYYVKTRASRAESDGMSGETRYVRPGEVGRRAV